MFTWKKKEVKEETPYSLLMEHGKMLLGMAQARYKQAEYHMQISCPSLAKDDVEAGKQFQDWGETTLARAEKLRRWQEGEQEIEAPSPVSEHATYRTK